MVPDFTRETFRAGTEHGGHDGSAGFPPQYAARSLRYLEWTYDPNPDDTQITVDFTYLLREDPDTVRCLYDRHICGLFPRATWMRLLRKAGFQPYTEPFDHSEVPGITDMFLGVKPG
jgi:hypothetical protein